MKRIPTIHTLSAILTFCFFLFAFTFLVPLPQSEPVEPQEAIAVWSEQAPQQAATSKQPTQSNKKLPSNQVQPNPQQQPAPPTLPNIIEKPKPKPLSNRLVEYHIAVALDNNAKELAGKQSVTWRNPGTKAVQELFFHTYPNAFESSKTTFMRESGGKLRNDSMTEDSIGSMKVSSIRDENGKELVTSLKYVQPDDGNADDRTLMRIKLKEPVLPGQSVTLTMSYQVKLPEVFARMGYKGEFVMAGQWFPKLAVYEKAGMRDRKEEGWNLHQYHGNSEFYANFGIYNVKITVPANFTVAATGFPAKRTLNDGKNKTYQFYADDVHDFAWAASPNFVYHEEKFSTEHLPGVKIKLYVDPSHKDLIDRYMLAAKKSLASYSEWYGAYPYSTLSVVVPPAGANGAGGMEYPTLVTGWAAENSEPGYDLERVIVHEIGHQFWYGMVASNEFEEAWLDEGFTSFVEEKVMQSEYDAVTYTPLESGYMVHPDALTKNSWDYRNHQHYAQNVYTRGKLVLLGIEQQLGEKSMRKALRTYFRDWKFRHPSTADFQRSLEKSTNSSWQAYFDQFIYGKQMVDYAIETMTTKPIKHNGKPAHETTITVVKLGGHYSDVPIQIRFADGSTVEKLLEGRKKAVELKILHKAPAVYAVVDPDYKLVLENNHINNFMRVELKPGQKERWTIGSSQIIESILGWLAW